MLVEADVAEAEAVQEAVPVLALSTGGLELPPGRGHNPKELHCRGPRSRPKHHHLLSVRKNIIMLFALDAKTSVLSKKKHHHLLLLQWRRSLKQRVHTMTMIMVMLIMVMMIDVGVGLGLNFGVY